MNPAVLIGEMVSEKAVLEIESMGYEVLRLPPFDRLDAPVRTHPDMLLRVIGTELFVSAAYFERAESVLSRFAEQRGLRVVVSKTAPYSPYPHDIACNALTAGGCLFGNLPHLAPEILDAAKKRGLRPVHVRQGYAACSTARVTGTAIITADAGIAAAARQNGIDVLLISPGHIRLPGYDCGFIGGASGLLGGTLCFFGAIEAHPDFSAIEAFCRVRKIAICSLSGGPLTDCGGIITG